MGSNRKLDENKLHSKFKLTVLNEDVLVTEQDVKDDFIKKNVKFTVDAIHVTYDKAPQDKTEPSETELTDEYQAYSMILSMMSCNISLFLENPHLLKIA